MEHDTGRVASTRAAVQALFTDRVDGLVAPSSVYAVFSRDGILYSGGFGEVDGRPPTVDTAYRIASCTKSFTTAALLVLVERGALSLGDRVGQHLALGPLTGPDGAAVEPPTLRQLAAMAGGLPTDDPWADRQESLSPEQFDALVGAGLRFTAPPGERFEYSNLGFALLGRVIEQVSGRRYVDFVTEELLRPLQLTGVGYDANLTGVDRIAVGHHRRDGAWQPLGWTGPGAFSAIGGVFATPRALAGWATWLAAAFTDADDTEQPLGRLSRRLMQSVQTLRPAAADSSQGYGLGLVVEETDRHGLVVAHSGGYPGYGAHLRWHPVSGIGILAFENATYSAPAVPVTAACQLILDETIVPDTEPPLWPETAAARLSVERLIRSWDDRLAAELFAENVELDEPLDRRRAAIAELVAGAGLDGRPRPLIDCSPISRTPAQLAWTVLGRTGSLRCEISLTPEQRPRVQTLVVRPG